MANASIVIGCAIGGATGSITDEAPGWAIGGATRSITDEVLRSATGSTLNCLRIHRRRYVTAAIMVIINVAVARPTSIGIHVEFPENWASEMLALLALFCPFTTSNATIEKVTNKRMARIMVIKTCQKEIHTTNLVFLYVSSQEKQNVWLLSMKRIY